MYLLHYIYRPTYKSGYYLSNYLIINIKHDLGHEIRLIK